MEDYKDQVSENGFRLWNLQQEIKKHVKEEIELKIRTNTALHLMIADDKVEINRLKEVIEDLKK